MTKSQAVVNTFSVVDSCSVVVVGSESGGWHRGREFFTEKKFPLPDEKRGKCHAHAG